MAKILFFNPPSKDIYLKTNVGVAAPSYPSLTLAVLAGHLTAKHSVKIIDLDLTCESALFTEISGFKPDIVATSAVTPNYLAAKSIMQKIKNNYPGITTIIGGVHVTSLPDEAAKETCFDIIVLGEGDTAIPELLSQSFKNITNKLYNSSSKNLKENLNSLPYPAWHLFDLDKYKNSKLSSQKNPVGLLETTRGCAFQCNFCNKLTFGNTYREKDPIRTVDEMEYMLKCGFKEIHIIDDSFTQNIDRAKAVCNEILKRNLKFPWSLFNGVRVDMVDLEFFRLAKKAGCWQVAFGIETGDQDILNRINKKTTLAQIENAVKLARKTGLSTFGFFIFALRGETEESMKRTIKFAKSLPLDIAKFDICIPYPGTPYYEELDAAGMIRTKDWSKYNCHQINEPLFNHPNLSWPLIQTYYKNAFREFYLRPAYITRRFIKSVCSGDIFHDIYYFSKSRW